MIWHLPAIRTYFRLSVWYAFTRHSKGHIISMSNRTHLVTLRLWGYWKNTQHIHNITPCHYGQYQLLCMSYFGANNITEKRFVLCGILVHVDKVWQELYLIHPRYLFMMQLMNKYNINNCTKIFVFFTFSKCIQTCGYFQIVLVRILRILMLRLCCELFDWILICI